MKIFVHVIFYRNLTARLDKIHKIVYHYNKENTP